VLVPEAALGAEPALGAEVVPVADLAAAVRWLRRAASTPGRDAVTER
jgi:hypothetical protein